MRMARRLAKRLLPLARAWADSLRAPQPPPISHSLHLPQWRPESLAVTSPTMIGSPLRSLSGDPGARREDPIGAAERSDGGAGERSDAGVGEVGNGSQRGRGGSGGVAPAGLGIGGERDWASLWEDGAIGTNRDAAAEEKAGDDDSVKRIDVPGGDLGNQVGGSGIEGAGEYAKSVNQGRGGLGTEEKAVGDDFVSGQRQGIDGPVLGTGDLGDLERGSATEGGGEPVKAAEGGESGIGAEGKGGDDFGRDDFAGGHGRGDEGPGGGWGHEERRGAIGGFGQTAKTVEGEAEARQGGEEVGKVAESEVWWQRKGRNLGLGEGEGVKASGEAPLGGPAGLGVEAARPASEDAEWRGEGEQVIEGLGESAAGFDDGLGGQSAGIVEGLGESSVGVVDRLDEPSAGVGGGALTSRAMEGEGGGQPAGVWGERGGDSVGHAQVGVGLKEGWRSPRSGGIQRMDSQEELGEGGGGMFVDDSGEDTRDRFNKMLEQAGMGAMDQGPRGQYHRGVWFDASYKPQKELVEQYLSEANMSSEERWKLARAKKRADFRRHEMDTGSTEVQVALLSDRISQLQGHLTTHRKDYASLRGLRKIISTRRKLLTYLRNNNFDAYSTLIGRLGLKDEYIKQDRFSKYREAARPQMK